MRKNITLIGMPGVGKSILGRELARRLKFKFLDVDEEITRKFGPLQKIVDDFGEDEFLKIEEKNVLNLKGINNCVISPGGSIVYSQKAMDFLKKNSRIVFLRASLKAIKKRLSNLKTRGIVGLKSKNLEKIYRERVPLYKKYADIVFYVPADFNRFPFIVLIKKCGLLNTEEHRRLINKQ